MSGQLQNGEQLQNNTVNSAMSINKRKNWNFKESLHKTKKLLRKHFKKI